MTVVGEVVAVDDLMTDEEREQMQAAAERLENGDEPPTGLYADDEAVAVASAEYADADRAEHLRAIMEAEERVDNAESDWLDCKEETKAAKSEMDAAVAKLRAVIRGAGAPQLPFPAGDEPAEAVAEDEVEAFADDAKPLHDEGAEFKLEWLETAHLRKLTGNKKILGMTMRLMATVSQLCGGQMVGTLEQWIAETENWEDVLASRKGFSADWVARLVDSLAAFRSIRPVPVAGDAPTVFDVGG
ncbi:hypothetical protein CA54_16980 [Symmachiella macrocystis]|uniref:Uncharacterized protein n=1 Tax=Symmachiella macrocystis TaxID=2527985 RepID=A0A5C6BM65_9PLAN|nr:hypothetical protein [Symmachiella macrocystis]TWU12872.1 hypothetical protein CA54_16980 [Symmachiella macrocystis]